MLRSSWMLGLFVLFFACNDGSDDVDEKCKAPKGTRSDLTLAVGASARPAIDEPSSCAKAAMMLTVHGSGKRPFSDSPGDGVCTVAGDATCTAIWRPAFRKALDEALKRELHDTESYSACGDTSAIHDWRQANDAATILDAELARWDVSDSYGISIEPETCVVAD